MKKLYYLPFVLALTLLASCGSEPVTVESLLSEMADRENIARYPDPAYTCAQFSSYDRATVSPDQEGWFGNWDRSMFIRIEEKGGKKEYVMMDTTGPGAVVRFWMTFAGKDSGKGILRIYIDNETVPVIEGGAMEILSGGKLVASPLASSVSDLTAYEMRGHNLYLPIPYAKHCKITYESENIKDPGAKTGGESVYYNINYRTYKPSTQVVSYSAAELAKAQPVLQTVQGKLAKPDRELPAATQKHPLTGTIAADSELSIAVDGEKAIRKLSFKLSAGNLEQALRSTVLSITYEDNKAPASVLSPLGDFFGTGYQIRPVSTWYTEVSADSTLTAWWVMPFRKNCKITLINTGEQQVEIIKGEVETSDWKWDSRSMYFGSYWRDYHHLETGEMKNNEGEGGPFDINYVQLQGQGVFVGDAVTLFNTVYAWWGEGDEKIYVDGEKFPSHIGTGTEDYYGYAWCRPEKFVNHPFIAQPDGSGNFDPGYTVNSRYRILDAIPFTSSLVFDMEMWHWTRATINFAPVSFYYMKEGTNTNRKQTIGDIKPVALKRDDIISPELIYVLKPQKCGYMEAEDMMLQQVSGGTFRYQNNVKYGWGNNMQAYWSNGKTGDKLYLTFVSGSGENLPVKVRFTTAPDYGKFRFKLNNKSISIDLYSKELALKTVDLGVVKLNKGINTVEVEITGTAPNEKKTTVFGFDRLIIGTE